MAYRHLDAGCVKDYPKWNVQARCENDAGNQRGVKKEKVDAIGNGRKEEEGENSFDKASNHTLFLTLVMNLTSYVNREERKYSFFFFSIYRVLNMPV